MAEPATRLIPRLRAMKNLLPLNDVAEMIGVHRLTLHGWVRKGTIPHFRLAGRIKFEPQAVADWLEKRHVG